MARKAKRKRGSGATGKSSGENRRSLKPSPTSKSTAHTTLTEPSRPTVKRLFAVSGNRCAFPRCKSELVDAESGSILGEICHIKGEKDGSARYDSAQSPANRQSYANLLLMCGSHHK